MFVRYNVIGGRETTVMESRVYEVAANLRRTKDFDTAVGALAAFAPDAEDFVARFQRANVSRRIATARYLLHEIEHAKRRTQEVAVEGTDRVHVEHIYPQTPDGPKWPNHAQILNRLENLTLLGKRRITSIKNADFATKKQDGYADSDILMTRELLALEALGHGGDRDASARAQRVGVRHLESIQGRRPQPTSPGRLSSKRQRASRTPISFQRFRLSPVGGMSGSVNTRCSSQRARVVSESIVMELRNRTSLNPKKSRPDVSRMCPAMDGKRLQEVGQRWSAKLLVKGSVGLIRPALETG